jgi:hypothetical protein
MMQGCKINGALCLLVGSWLVFSAGCGPLGRKPPAASVPRQKGVGTHFNPKTAATISGKVTWKGAVPQVAPFRVRFNQPPNSPPQPKLFFENPNAPAVAADCCGVANAVVFLRGLNPQRGKPWDLPEVVVEQRDRCFHVRQGKADGRVGFVRWGDAVALVSRDTFFYSLHAGGAAFFTLAFADPDQPISRRPAEKGLIELTSGAGYFWMRAYLFVDDHPYYACTDAQGRFTLDGVPPGSYDVVCWLPSWRVQRSERDPESGQVSRLSFGRPAEIVKPVTVKPGGRHTVLFRVGTASFENDRSSGK